MEEERLPLRAHQFGGWQTPVDHPCEQEGEQSRYCMLCAASETKPMESRAHHYAAWQTILEPSCTQAGLRQRNCRRCLVSVQEALPQKPHRFGRWVMTNKAACNLEGSELRSCKHCDLQEQRSIEALQHWPGRWRVGKPAQLDRPGEQVKRCRRCDAVVERRSYSRPRSAFAVSSVSFGIPLEAINPGSRKPYMLTPIDLRAEGLFRYPLIGGGTHCIGEVRVLVEMGKLSIGYSFFADSTELVRPSLRILDSLDGLSDRELELRRRQRPFDQPMDIQRSFKDKRIVFMAMRLETLFDARDPRNFPYSLDAAAPEGILPYRDMLRYLEDLYAQFKEEEHIVESGHI